MVRLTRLSSYQSISLLRFTVVIICMLSSYTLVGYPTTKSKVRVRPTTGRTEGEGCSCIYHSPSFSNSYLKIHTFILYDYDHCSHLSPSQPPLHPSLHTVVYNYVQHPPSLCLGRNLKQKADMLISLVFVSKQTLIQSLRRLLWLGTIYREIGLYIIIYYYAHTCNKC